MNREKILIVDVDQVLVDMAPAWLDRLNKLANTSHTYESIGNVYDFHKFFKETHNVDDGFNFWEAADLYDTVLPMQDSIYALSVLKNSGFKIYAASYCLGNHHRSKTDFLERWYSGLIDDMIATKHKHLLKCNVIIDDRNEYMHKCDPCVFTVRMNTPFRQTINYTPRHVMSDWSDGEVFKLLNAIKLAERMVC